MSEHIRLCTFMIADSYFGIDVLSVQEVLRDQAITRVPLASADIAGLINLRGQIVTAIDLRRRLQLEDRPAGSRPLTVVVITTDGPVALLVDEVGDVVDVSMDDLEPSPPTLTESERTLVRGAFKLPGRLLLFLDIDAAVSPRRQSLARSELK